MEKMSEQQLLVARTESKKYLSVGNELFSKLKFKTSLDFFEKKMNSHYESLGCVGYNPAFNELTAHIKIHRPIGYSGNLCTDGSYEYVRFYMDYQDGDGWEDMGFVGVNVHDIPTEQDCDDKDEKPIDYVVRLKINPKRKSCTKPNLPIVKAVLSWNAIPEPNDPNLTVGTYIWGDLKEVQIQIEPLKFTIPVFDFDFGFGFDDLFYKAIINPNLSLNSLISLNPDKVSTFNKAKEAIKVKDLNFGALVNKYKDECIKPHRFAYKMIQQSIETPYFGGISDLSSLFADHNFSIADSLVNLQQTECNQDYEELICVGADYNNEALVGTLKIKKSSGYNGNLCDKGSKEYVSFWIQTENDCEWKHAGTTFVEVHDIPDISDDGLFYSVILPYKFSGLKKSCRKPQVLKVRAILSWNSKPTGMGCSHWGNVESTYIQIKPREEHLLVSVGGVSTSYIDDSSGLTIEGDYKFGFNGAPVTPRSTFAGRIVVQGLSDRFAGQKYKIRIDNLDTGVSWYWNKDLELEGYDADAGTVVITTVSPVGDVYTYQGNDLNTYDVIARMEKRDFNGDHKISITVEHLDGSSDSQVIKLDNTSPVLELNIDEYGDCSHFTKGHPISGGFSVEEAHFFNYKLSTNINDDAGSNVLEDGTDERGLITGKFNFTASATKNCGEITLTATPRTVVNSVRMLSDVKLEKNICLKDA